MVQSAGRIIGLGERGGRERKEEREGRGWGEKRREERETISELMIHTTLSMYNIPFSDSLQK